MERQRTLWGGDPPRWTRRLVVNAAEVIPAGPPLQQFPGTGEGMLSLLANTPFVGSPDYTRQLDFHIPNVMDIRSLAIVCRSWAAVLHRRAWAVPGRRLRIRWDRLHVTEEHQNGTEISAAMPPGVVHSLPIWLSGLHTLHVHGQLPVPSVADAYSLTLPALPQLRTLMLEISNYDNLNVDLAKLPALERLGIFAEYTGGPNGEGPNRSARLDIIGVATVRHLSLVTRCWNLPKLRFVLHDPEETFWLVGNAPAEVAEMVRHLHTLTVAAGGDYQDLPRLLADLGIHRNRPADVQPTVYTATWLPRRGVRWEAFRTITQNTLNLPDMHPIPFEVHGTAEPETTGVRLVDFLNSR